MSRRRCPRRYRAGRFAVASAFDVPLADASLDLAISVFAPCKPDELRRLLRPGALYLKVTPAPDHLWALRELLYEQARPHAVQSQLLPSFEVVGEETVAYPLELSGELLRDVVAMTPYAHRGLRSGHSGLDELRQITLGMSFSLSLQRYRP